MVSSSLWPPEEGDFLNIPRNTRDLMRRRGPSATWAYFLAAKSDDSTSSSLGN
jgi:hypothetical protein